MTWPSARRTVTCPYSSSLKPSDTPEATMSTVPWYTVLYTIVPLATAAISQPIGSVLGTNPSSRTWIRSSPLFCIIDCFAFTVQVLYNSFVSRSSLPVAFLFETEVRFKDVDEAERLATLGRGFVMRWLFFLIGTHSSFLKLVGAHGLPWTKAIGLGYATSFVFWEVVIWLYPKLQKNGLSRSMLMGRSERPTEFGFWVACCAQLLMTLWSIWDLVGIETRKVSRRPDREYSQLGPLNWLLAFVSLATGSACLVGMTWFRQKVIFTIWFMVGWMCCFLPHLAYLLNERLPESMEVDENGERVINYELQNRWSGAVFATSSAILVHHYLWSFWRYSFRAWRKGFSSSSPARRDQSGEGRSRFQSRRNRNGWFGGRSRIATGY